MLCALASLLIALVAAAEPPAPGLNWVRLPGAEACIGAAHLGQRVEERVGRVLFAACSEAGLFVDGHVAPAPAPQTGWHVRLELSDREGKVLGRRDMQFANTDCHAIDEAVALVIAVTLYPNTALLEQGIALDPSTAAHLQSLFGSEPLDPDPASLPSPNGAAANAPAAVVAAQPDPRSDRAVPVARSSAPPTTSSAWSVELDAVATSGIGHVPGLGFGVAAHVALTPPDAWPIEAGLVLFPVTTERPEGASGSVRFDALAATLALCPWQPEWWRALALCAGAELGRLHVQSEGFPEGAVNTNDAIASLTGSARIAAPLFGPLALRFALIAGVPIAQHRYTVETDTGGTAQVFRIPQLAARAELGLGLQF